jgi:hypothetical protein
MNHQPLLPAQLDSDLAKARLYADLTHDYNPIHTDADFAAATPFGAPIVHGTMALNLLIESLEKTWGSIPPGTAIEVKFTRPAPVGSKLVAGGEPRADDHAIHDVFVALASGEPIIEGTANLPAAGTPI